MAAPKNIVAKTEDPIVLFQVNLVSADDCTGSFEHKVLKSGKLGRQVSKPWDAEPERETEFADITVVHASGKEVRLDLTGHQHRDLENFGNYENVFNDILGGASIEDAVRQRLVEEDLGDAQRPQQVKSRPGMR